MDFQLEAAYRQRLAEVGQAVKKRLVHRCLLYIIVTLAVFIAWLWTDQTCVGLFWLFSYMVVLSFCVVVGCNYVDLSLLL